MFVSSNVLQESELPEDNPPQKPLRLVRAELHLDRCLVDDATETHVAHLEQFCE